MGEGAGWWLGGGGGLGKAGNIIIRRMRIITLYKRIAHNDRLPVHAYFSTQSR